MPEPEPADLATAPVAGSARPRSPGRSPRRRAVEALLTILVVAFTARILWQQWETVGTARFDRDIHLGWLGASTALVFITYAVLIETWRRTLLTWGSAPAFGPAAAIWSISNLGKYVPGKVWQIGAMTVMLHQRGVGPAQSASAAILITVANVLVGFIIALATGRDALAAVPASILYTMMAALLVLLVVLPRVMPLLFAIAARILRRPIRQTAPTPWRALVIATVGCAIAWMLYGIAFRWFTIAMLGEAPGSGLAYVGAYAGSYLLGYVAVFAPGGIGVRELALTTALPALGIAAGSDAVVLTVASRVWLTVTELLPGLGYLIASRLGRETLDA